MFFFTSLIEPEVIPYDSSHVIQNFSEAQNCSLKTLNSCSKFKQLSPLIHECFLYQTVFDGVGLLWETGHSGLFFLSAA